MEEAVALLGDDSGDDAFVGIVVEDYGVGHVFVFVLLEEGFTDGFAVGVGDGTGTEYLAVEIYTYVVGFQFHAVVFDDAFGVELCFVFVNVDGYGVFGFVVDDAGDGIGREGDGGEGRGGGKGVEGVGEVRKGVGKSGKGVAQRVEGVNGMSGGQ